MTETTDMIRGAAEAQASIMRETGKLVEIGRANGELAHECVGRMAGASVETVTAWDNAFEKAEAGEADLIDITVPIIGCAVDTIAAGLDLLNALGIDTEAAWQELIYSKKHDSSPNYFGVIMDSWELK